MFQKILFQIHVVLVIKESWKNASQLAQKCEAAQLFVFNILHEHQISILECVSVHFQGILGEI